MKDEAARADSDALRIDLAAAFRLTARFGWHESVGNHFSAALSADGRRFLMNPKWRHFAAIRASDLLLSPAAGHGARRPEGPRAAADRHEHCAVLGRCRHRP